MKTTTLNLLALTALTGLLAMPVAAQYPQRFSSTERAIGTTANDWSFMTAWHLGTGGQQVSPNWYNGNSTWNYYQPFRNSWVAKFIYRTSVGQTRELQWSYTQVHVQFPSPSGDYLVIDLSSGPAASSYPVSYLNDVPAGGWTDAYKTTKLVMRRIPKGTFTMGSPSNELGRKSNETQRQVTLTKDYYMGVFPVTQKQWERVMGNWPSWFNNAAYRDARPVERVSYFDIRENADSNSAISPNWLASSQVHVNSFMGKLRAKTGLTTLDLPTEAQRERSARAGTGTALNSGKNLTNTGSCPNMSEVGRYWYNGGSGFTQGGSTAVGSAKVGSYLPNAWGLYDMHGNVLEWCLDWYETYHAVTTDPLGAASGVIRVARGGCWYYFAEDCRSAFRSGGLPDERNSNWGFRLSRTLP